MDFETKLWDVRVAFPTFCVAFQRRPCIVRGIVFHARCFFVVTGPAVSSQVFFSDQPFVYPCFRVSVQTRGGVRHLHLPTACRACAPTPPWLVRLCACVASRLEPRGRTAHPPCAASPRSPSAAERLLRSPPRTCGCGTCGPSRCGTSLRPLCTRTAESTASGKRKQSWVKGWLVGALETCECFFPTTIFYWSACRVVTNVYSGLPIATARALYR